eukprot:COSAG06_NODE_47283_length_340_cov_0.850622_1_plen_60_part_10
MFPGNRVKVLRGLFSGYFSNVGSYVHPARIKVSKPPFLRPSIPQSTQWRPLAESTEAEAA